MIRRSASNTKKHREFHVKQQRWADRANGMPRETNYLGMAAPPIPAWSFIMKTARLALLSICLSCSASVHATNWLASQITYEAEGWTVGQPYGLNNLGQVIGMMDPATPRPPGIWEMVEMGFVTGPNGRNMRPIDPHYEPYVEYCHGCAHPLTPRAINDAGQIAVTTYDYWLDLTLTLAGPGGRVISLPPGVLGIFGVDVSLNNSGQLAGTYYHSAPASFVTEANGDNPYSPGMLDNSYDSHISDINNHGQLLIWGTPTGAPEPIQFVSGPNATGIAFETGTFGYSSGAHDINDSAQLLGTYFATPGGEQRAFITGANGIGFMDIGSLGGPTFASALNNNGLVVGSSANQAFIYGLNGGGITNLNSFITLSGGEFLSSAVDINDRGQVLAQSNLGNMYLLAPVPEPATYLMLLSGLALIYWRTRPHAISFT